MGEAQQSGAGYSRKRDSLISADLLAESRCKTSLGEHLQKVQAVLEPHNVFGRFLKNTFHMSVRQAYRYIAMAKNAKAGLPEPVFKVAVARGMDIAGTSDAKPFGAYTEAIRRMPPPATATEEQAATYLTQLDDVRKQVRSEAATGITLVPADPETTVRECYKFVTLKFKRLPQNKRTLHAAQQKLIGLLIADWGLGAQTFIPVQVPESYKVGRGRPAQTGLTVASA